MNAPSELKELDRLWKDLRLTDRKRLAPLRTRFLASLRSNEDAAEERALFREKLEHARKRSLVPSAEKLQIRYPAELPITGKIPEIRKALRENPLVIVCGATGSGKTTQLPKAALEEGFGRAGRIGCTQPRRIAASALAGRLAAECGCVCGQEIGYQVRFENQTTDATTVKFMTDGILLAETRNDPDLLQYDCLILDEIHERTLNIDFLLGYVRQLLKRRRDLRVILSSATLAAEKISAFFGNAPVIEAEGRTYPVEDCYLPPEEEEELPENAARATDFLTELDPSGDILVFLPGEREIRDCAELFGQRFGGDSEILPLFGRLSASEQAGIFRRGTRRRIILSTNVAETSLTIPGIRFVIDSGLVRISRYNPKSRIQELRIETVSRASAMQRRGRCGRTGDGVCVRLYSEEDFQNAEEYTAPEIQRSSLAGVILQMALLHLPPIDVFPFVDPPSPSLIREGMSALRDLGAIQENGRITPRGRELALLPLDPHLGTVLLAGKEYGLLPQLAVASAFLSIPDPRERPFEKTGEADAAHKKYLSDTSDFLSILHLWCAVRDEAGESHAKLRRYARENFLNFRRLREWKNLASDLMSSLGESAGIPPFDSFRTPFEPLHKAFLRGLPRQLACRIPEENAYSDMNGRKLSLFPGSGLAKRKNPPSWILSFATVETSRVFARCAAEINPVWLEETAPAVCRKIYDRIEWDETTGFVSARERVMAGRLLIHPGRRCHYGRIDPVRAREVFIRDGLVPGRFRIARTWAADYVRKLRLLRAFEIKCRRPDSIVNEAALEEHFRKVIPETMCSLRDLKQDWMETKRSYMPSGGDFLYEDPDQLPFDEFPDSLESGGIRIRVRYRHDPGEEGDGLTYEIPESCLNLTGRHIADYPVAGYMRWKIEFALRSLPKSVRKELLPLSGCAERFMEKYRSGALFTDQPFARTVRDFLREDADLDLPEDTLEDIEYPAYLRIRIAAVDEEGKTVRILDRIPSGGPAASTVSSGLPAARQFTRSGCRTWPEGLLLPRSVQPVPGNPKTAFPALTDEKESVGAALFLEEDEAVRHHRAALVRLFRLRFPDMIRQFRTMCRPSPRMALTLFSDYSGWLEDLTSHSILSSLDRAPEDIRSAEEWERELETVRDNAAGIVQNNFEFLARIADDLSPIEEMLRNFRGDAPVRMDVRLQLDFLFRDGFFRTPEAVAEYPRWLKAVSVRLERARTSPAKDRAKGEFLEEPLRKFRTALQSGTDPADSPSLLDLFLLIEEARITAWSPEIPTKRKASSAALQSAWNALRI